MFTDIPPHELNALLDREAARLLKVAGICAPPVDAIRLAAALRIEIAVDRRQQARARFVELRGARGGSSRSAILLRDEPRIERRHWAIAHEIGEQHASEIFRQAGVDARSASQDAREWVANQMANRLMLPARWFARCGAECEWDLLQLKARFDTASHELILRRMLDCEPPIVVSIFDNGELSFRRANCGRVPPRTALERRCWEAAHATGTEHCQTDGFQVVRAWAVHEEGWQRELLRWDVACDDVGFAT